MVEFACGVDLSTVPSVVNSGNASTGKVDCEGMASLVRVAEQGELEIDEGTRIEDNGVSSIRFYQGMELLAIGREIPNTGHYDYALYNKQGKYIGYVKLLVGKNFYDVTGKEVFWDKPVGFPSQPGVKEVKVKDRVQAPAAPPCSNPYDCSQLLFDMISLIRLARAGALRVGRGSNDGTDRIVFYGAAGEKVAQTEKLRRIDERYAIENLAGRIIGYMQMFDRAGTYFYNGEGKVIAWADSTYIGPAKFYPPPAKAEKIQLIWVR